MATSNKLGMYLPTREDYISVKRDISDNLAILDAAAGDMDIIINGNTSSKNVTSGQFVTVLNSTITGVTDGIYKSVANVAAGVPFVAANLTTTTSGALNELVLTLKAYTVTTNENSTVASATGNAFTRYGTLDITTDMQAYGQPISIIAKGYGDIPVPAFVPSMADMSKNIRVLNYATAATADVRVIFCKNVSTAS